MPAIVTKALSKKFGDFIAVNAVDLSVEGGELFDSIVVFIAARWFSKAE